MKNRQFSFIFFTSSNGRNRDISWAEEEENRVLINDGSPRWRVLDTFPFSILGKIPRMLRIFSKLLSWLPGGK